MVPSVRKMISFTSNCIIDNIKRTITIKIIFLYSATFLKNSIITYFRFTTLLLLKILKQCHRTLSWNSREKNKSFLLYPIFVWYRPNPEKKHLHQTTRHLVWGSRGSEYRQNFLNIFYRAKSMYVIKSLFMLISNSLIY